MSKPAVFASRAISTPRVRRMVIEATTSLRASFSLTMFFTISFARTNLLLERFYASSFRQIGQFDSQHHIAQTLAMNVLRQRDGDAAAQRIFDDEIEGLEIAQRVTPDRTCCDVFERLRYPFRCEFSFEKIPMLGIVADHGNI